MGNRIMPDTYQVRMKTRHQVAADTLAVYFERPTSFSFTAGQFIDVMLLDPPELDSQGTTRAFTLASAPCEDDLMIATRLRDSAFKRVWSRAPLETLVNIEGPFGTFTLPDTMPQPLVFLAGGIGITPFRSMLIQAVHDQRPNRMVLCYANRRPEDAAFLEELQRLQQTIPHFTFVPTMTNLQHSQREWTGETEYCDPTMLRKYITNLEETHYYVVPP